MKKYSILLSVFAVCNMLSTSHGGKREVGQLLLVDNYYANGVMCPKCNKQYSQENFPTHMLYMHSNSEHSELTEASESYENSEECDIDCVSEKKCPECNTQYQNQHHLYRHMILVNHLNDLSFHHKFYEYRQEYLTTKNDDSLINCKAILMHTLQDYGADISITENYETIYKNLHLNT